LGGENVLTALAVLGLVGLLSGVLAFRALRVPEGTVRTPWSRPAALIVGGVMGAASLALTGWMSYPYADGERGVGHVAGIPFIAVYFDARGADYVGPLTLPAVAGNAAFWFLVPQLLLYVGTALRRRRAVGEP